MSLPTFLVDLLKEHVAGKGPEDFVFTSRRGGQLRHGNYRNRHFKKAVERLVDSGRWPDPPRRKGDDGPGLRDLRPHDLRHTAASLLIRQGVHPKLVSEHLGHSSIAITMDRYGHLYPDSHEAILRALNATYDQVAAEDGQVTALANR